MLEDLTVESFAPLKDGRFRLTHGSGEGFEVELIEVSPLGKEPAAGSGPGTSRRPFSLVFRGPKEPLLPQGIYPVACGELGTLELFLVPIGYDEKGLRYQAVFT